MEFDLSNLFWMGMPITVLITGIVAFLKKVGVKGEWLTVASLVVGAGLGFLAKLEMSGAPVEGDWLGWVKMAAFGLLCGLTASGLYSQAKTMLTLLLAQVKEVIEKFFSGDLFLVEEDPEQPQE